MRSTFPKPFLRTLVMRDINGYANFKKNLSNLGNGELKSSIFLCSKHLQHFLAHSWTLWLSKKEYDMLQRCDFNHQSRPPMCGPMTTHSRSSLALVKNVSRSCL